MKFQMWIKHQLDELNAPEEFDESTADELRVVIHEAEHRAAMEGCPDAVQACQIRATGISATIARNILYMCLACVQAKQPAPEKSTESESLTADETARLLGCSKRSLWRWEAEGKIPEGRRIGGTVRWDRKAIERLL